MSDDLTLTDLPVLWHVQYADESKDCDGIYPLTALYVMARCEDSASNRADEDFDTFEGVTCVGPYDIRPATAREVQDWTFRLIATGKELHE